MNWFDRHGSALLVVLCAVNAVFATVNLVTALWPCP